MDEVGLLSAQRDTLVQELSRVQRARLASLAMMDSGLVSPLYSYVRDTVAGLWRESFAAVGRNTRTSLRDPLGEEQRWATEFYELLAHELPDAKYGGWLRTQRLARDPRPYEGTPKIDKDDALPDVLNAVWLWRLQHAEQTGDEYETQQVEQTMKWLCLDIAVQTKNSGGRRG